MYVWLFVCWLCYGLFVIVLCVGGCVVMFGGCLRFARLFCFREHVCLIVACDYACWYRCWCLRSFGCRCCVFVLLRVVC